MSGLQQSMTDDELFTLIQASLAAAKAGDHEEEERLLNELPLHPRIANVAKSIYGPEDLAKQGFNLSMAIEAFGDDWLKK
ncbi:hypothetical protein LJB99_00140 [Deltaproteobacteria bacterium OttesenSCG-928-K17]|nr:hypothetical protein [Deltaproteobacteria bacterium OttesenSCG-928-K17]